ncbi:MAG: hypothetical protein WBN32_05225 [Woeseia sp.]
MQFPRFMLALWLLLPAVVSAETTEVSASVARIDAADWHLERLDTVLEFADSGVRAVIGIGRVALVATDMTFDDTRIDCGRVLLSRGHFRCEDALLAADLPGVGRVSVAAEFDYERDSGITHFNLKRLPVAGGEIDVRGKTGDTGTEANFSGRNLQVAGLLAVANALGIGPGAMEAAGTLDLTGSFSTRSDGRLLVQAESTLHAVSLSNELGTLVTDSLNGTLSANAANDGSGWQLDFGFRADHGEAYVEPLYANFAEHALALRANGVSTKDFQAFTIREFRIEQDTQLRLEGNARIVLAATEAEKFSFSGAIDIIDTSLEAVYVNVLRILAAGTLLGDLETDGRIAGHIVVANNEPQSATLELHDLILDDLKRRFALYGINGTLHWPGPDASPGAAPASQLSWDSGNAYNVEVGASQIDARLGGDDFELLQPLRIPTMGGALLVNQLVVNDYFSNDTNGLLDAELEPVQLGQLSGAFGWPAFSGSLAGRLPLLQYQGNAMTVGGTLTANAFGGAIEVSGLRIAQPFGRVPRLDANITLRGLDLERLTNTFSFGLIQGTLSGDVTGLSMIGWQAAAMDLHLYTPEKDRTPHRISQRAVENLASVGGGGAAAALSSGFLKFFEVFAYDRIALRCVLRDGSCAMSGAGEAGDGPLGKGFYIVKGKGIPRIDVVGYRSKVSWASLVRQLANITRSEAPVIN